MATRKSAGDDTSEPESEWRQVIRTVSALPTADPIDGGDAPEETSADRVARMLSSIGNGRSIVKLYRVRNGRREWCNDYTAQQFEQGGLNAIRDDWGHGEFEVVLYAERTLPNGKAHFGVRGRESVEIAAPKTPAPVAPAQGSGATPELIHALEAIAQSQALILQALNNRPPVDPQAQMMQTFQMLKLAREAFAPANAPQSQISEIVAAMKELRSASAELGDGPSDPLTAALPGMLELIKSGIQRPSEPVTFPTVTLPASVAPNPVELPAPAAKPATPPNEVAGPSEAELVQALRMHLNVLIDLAKKGTPIEEGANLVYEHSPDEVIETLAFPNWLDLLQEFEPAVKPHAKWFGDVGARVKAMMAEENVEGKTS